MQLQHGASLASCCLQTRQWHAPCRPPGLPCRRQQPSSSVAPHSSKQLAATTGATTPSPSSQQPQTSAAAAPDAPGPSTPSTVPGFCGLPLVDSPGAFRAYYYRRTRPRLDALYRACSSYRQGEVQLLDALDALLCELKSLQAKARHCAQRHASREWRDAAAEVSAACDKFEQYLYRSTAIYSKVRQLAAALQQRCEQLQDHAPAPQATQTQHLDHDQQQPSTINSAQPPLPPSPPSPSFASATNASLPLALSSLPASQALALLRLAELLLQPFERQQPQVEDGLSHLMLVGGHAAAASGTAAWQVAADLSVKERQAAVAVRAVLGGQPGVGAGGGAGGPPLLLHLDQVDWSMGPSTSATGSDRQAAGGGGAVVDGMESDSECSEPQGPRLEADDADTQARGAYGLAVASSDNDSTKGVSTSVSSNGGGALSPSSSPNCPWECDPMLQPLLERSQAMGAPPGALLLDLPAVQRLLRYHPHAGLRKAVYVAGLLPRKVLMLRVRQRLASVRSALAKALQSPSAAHLGLAPLLLGTPSAAAALLEACAEAARPAAEEQLRNMAAVLQQQQQQQEQEQLQGGGGAAVAGSAGLDPWDVAYAQQQLLAQACPLLAKGGDLLRYITLKGVLQGLATLLSHTMGITLELQDPLPQPSTTSTGDATDADPFAPGGFGFGHDSEAEQRQEAFPGGVEVWGPQVLTVHVCVPETGAQGTLYLDPGGGYGARQLHFSRSGLQHGADAAMSARSEGGEVPCVSLGLRWRWPQGAADGLPALWELLHECGHALHLLLSSCATTRTDTHTRPGSGDSSCSSDDVGSVAGGACDSGSVTGPVWKHFSGLHLPLDLLEVPSTLMEQLAMHPRTLAVILGVQGPAHGPDGVSEQGAMGVQETGTQGQDEGGGSLSFDVVCQLAEQYRAQHYNALGFQEQVLVALADLLANLHGSGAGDVEHIWHMVWNQWSPLPAAAAVAGQAARQQTAGGSGANGVEQGTVAQEQGQRQREVDVEERAGREEYEAEEEEEEEAESLLLAPGYITTLKQLSVASVVAHHQSTYSAYILAFLLASAAWDTYLARDPLDPRAGRALRQHLFEVGAGQDPLLLVQALLTGNGGQAGVAPGGWGGVYVAARGAEGADGGLEVAVDCEHLRRWLWTGS